MNWFWDNIHLKKEERGGMFIFICMLFCLLLVKWYLTVWYVPEFMENNVAILANMEYAIIEPAKNDVNPSFKIAPASPKKKTKRKKKVKKHDIQKEVKEIKSLFRFDPNTASVDSLQLLGLGKYVVNNISKYRAKGGRFKNAKDLQKIYGMDSTIFEEIYPYIDIKKSKFDFKSKEIKEKPIAYSKPKLELNSIDINRADTTEFKKLRGIGSVYANRIVKFRNSLGGYFSVDQIKDVWGISDSLYIAIKPYFILNPDTVQKKNINLLTKEELVKHPYIDWKKAKVIQSYQKMHGDYKSMDDFKKMHGISEAFVDTLTHYFVAE